MSFLAVFLAGLAIGGGIGWHLGFMTASDRAGHEPFSPEVKKWTEAKWPKPGA